MGIENKKYLGKNVIQRVAKTQTGGQKLNSHFLIEFHGEKSYAKRVLPENRGRIV
jgi:hypothetical protein